MIVFEFTSENQILEKLLPPPMRLAVSQNFRFSYENIGHVNKLFFHVL